IAEELWHELGYTGSLFGESWPVYREDALKEEQILIVLQVDGKVRSRIIIPASTPEEEVKKVALADEKARKFLQGKTVKNVILVPGRLVNIVTS
ncbi:MAG: class I tRNA ligase family protein, partial [Nitrospira sp.]|nr:class I tRNA ligase family protein [Nitrospira sp.]